jgi:hypothetical protein
MKKNWKMAAFVVGVLLLTASARAAGSVAKSNPYSVIAQHNVFGLIPPPPPTDVSAEAASPPDIILNGIMNVFGSKYALFKLTADKGKNYLLGEGQSDGEIELLSVDDRAGAIKVKNHGVIQTIALAKPPAFTSTPAATTAGAVPTMAAPDNDAGRVPAEGIPFSATENNPAAVNAPMAPGFAVVGVGNSQGNSSGNSTPSNGSSGSQASGGSSSAPEAAPEPWWVIGSKNLEAARIATASLVSSGQNQPFPLTPYTPPGTPANLIGPGQLYFVPQSN